MKREARNEKEKKHAHVSCICWIAEAWRAEGMRLRVRYWSSSLSERRYVAVSMSFFVASICAPKERLGPRTERKREREGERDIYRAMRERERERERDRQRQTDSEREKAQREGAEREKREPKDKIEMESHKLRVAAKNEGV